MQIPFLGGGGGRKEGIIGAKKRTQTYFSQTFRASPGYLGENRGISRPQVWFPWVWSDILNFLTPTRSRGRPPPHRKISGPKRLGLCSFLLPERGVWVIVWGAVLFLTKRFWCKLFHLLVCFLEGGLGSTSDDADMASEAVWVK